MQEITHIEKQRAIGKYALNTNKKPQDIEVIASKAYQKAEPLPSRFENAVPGE